MRSLKTLRSDEQGIALVMALLMVLAVSVVTGSLVMVARSEALTRNVEVTVAPSSDDWAHGWTIRDAGGTVLREQPAYGLIAVSGPQRVTFTGDGRPSASAGPFAVTASSADVRYYRCVRLRLNGRPYVAQGACS